MKEVYFTEKNIHKKSLEMLQRVEVFRKKHVVEFLLEDSALLILDMQKYFLKSSSHAYIPSSSAIIPGIRSLINYYSERNLPIIFTRHINSPGDTGIMDKWWKDLIHEDNPLSMITERLDSSKGKIIRKAQYDAFYNTSLEETLEKKKVKRVVICGVMTHLCCETTARTAFIRGFEVLFTIDGTATYNEEFHMATLLNLSHGFAIPVCIEELLHSIKEKDED